jgi:hypothetical protein
MRTKRVEFAPPEGSVPEGLGAGEDFDLVCTFRVKDNGEVCLVKFGDTDMPDTAKVGATTKGNYREMASDMANSSMEG